MAAAFGLSVCAWAPMAGGILTGKYTAAPPPWKISRRAPANQVRLSEGNRQIARAVDGVADELGSTLARVALAWVRQRDRRIIPIVGVRALEQLENVLGCLELRLPGRAAGRLDEVSRMELGFPYELLRGIPRPAGLRRPRALDRPATGGAHPMGIAVAARSARVRKRDLAGARQRTLSCPQALVDLV